MVVEEGRSAYAFIRTSLNGQKPPLRVVFVAKRDQDEREITECEEMEFDQRKVKSFLLDACNKYLTISAEKTIFKTLRIGEDLDKDQIGLISIGNHPTLQKFAEEVQLSFINTSRYSNKSLFNRNLKFIIMRLKIGDKFAYFFKTLTQRHRLTKPGKLAITLRRNQFNALEESSFLLDRDIKFLLYDGQYFVKDVNFFEKTTGYHGAIREKAVKLLEGVVRDFQFDDSDSFQEHVLSDTVLQRRAAYVSRYYDPKKHTAEYVINRAKKYRVKIPYSRKSDGSIQFNLLKDRPARFRLLSLLDDHYVTGENSGWRLKIVGGLQRIKR